MPKHLSCNWIFVGLKFILFNIIKKWGKVIKRLNFLQSSLDVCIFHNFIIKGGWHCEHNYFLCFDCKYNISCLFTTNQSKTVIIITLFFILFFQRMTLDEPSSQNQNLFVFNNVKDLLVFLVAKIIIVSEIYVRDRKNLCVFSFTLQRYNTKANSMFANWHNLPSLLGSGLGRPSGCARVKVRWHQVHRNRVRGRARSYGCN